MWTVIAGMGGVGVVARVSWSVSKHSSAHAHDVLVVLWLIGIEIELWSSLAGLIGSNSAKLATGYRARLREF